SFLYVSDQGGGNQVPTGLGWLALLLISGGLVAASIVLGRVGSRPWRSACYGTGAAVSFAVCAAFMKSTTTLYAKHGIVHLFGHFEPYAIALSGLSGLFLTQN